MAISQSEFNALDPARHKIVDCRGEDWLVKEKNQDGVVLVSPGNTAGVFMWAENMIVDSFGIDVTLNNSMAHVATL